MKKLFITIILSISLLISGCKLFKTEIKEVEDEIKLSIKPDFIPYLDYSRDQIPTFTFKFDGKINTALRTTGPNEVVFTNNDDFRISNMIEDLLKDYEENGIIGYRDISVTEKYETHMNKHTVDENGTVKSERVYLKVTDGKIYNKIAYITLDNGLQLTINYAQFEGEAEGKKDIYYTWQYTESIRMILYYPLMVVQEADTLKKKILIVALPNRVINKIETRYDVYGLIKKDTYLDSSYYTYPYPDYDQETSGKDYDPTESINSIKEYYTKYWNGREENGEFIYTYLGFDFKVTFEKTDFILTYIE